MGDLVSDPAGLYLRLKSMQVGNTTMVVHTETRSTAFAASAESVVVTAPDGTTSSPDVTVSPGTSATSQVFTFPVTPTMGGLYVMTGQYTDQTDAVINWTQSWFATWTDVRDGFNVRTGAAGQLLDDADFYREYEYVTLLLLTRWPCVGNGVGTTATLGLYNALSYPDTSFFDEAAMLLLCARLIGPLSTKGAASDIIARDEGDEKTRLAEAGKTIGEATASPGDSGSGPGGYSGASDRVRWLREAAEKLGMVSTVRQSNSARAAGFNPFTVAGPTRRSIAMGNPQSLLSSIVRLLEENATVPFGWGGEDD